MLRKFLSLTVSDQWLLVQCLILVALIRLGLNTFKVVRVQRALDRVFPERPQSQSARNSVDRVTWAIQAASRLVPRATCLTQALATQAMYRRVGLATQLHYGVMRGEKGEFLAHAWVEDNGRVVIGENGMLPHYTALPSIQ